MMEEAMRRCDGLSDRLEPSGTLDGTAVRTNSSGPRRAPGRRRGDGARGVDGRSDGGSEQLDAALAARIAARAAAADRGERDLARDVDELRWAGWLRVSAAPSDARAEERMEAVERLIDALRALGRANLSVARLYEGHVNAAKLIGLYGDAEAREIACAAIERGTLMGVWGAEGAPPLRIGGDGELSGTKRFASGLGLVGLAVVSLADERGPRLLLCRTDDAARCRTDDWHVTGMRATASGTFDFDGLVPLAELGEPGDYVREPHFEGGTWRYCAAHLGGAEALADETRRMLARSGRADDPHQADRIARMAMACETARLWVTGAARRVEGEPDDAEGAAAYALLAREAVERACLEVIDLAERALGMAAHAEGLPIARMRRDLSMFLRQAAPDAKRMRAAAALVERDARAESL